jgi:hypothetical protein
MIPYVDIIDLCSQDQVTTDLDDSEPEQDQEEEHERETDDYDMGFVMSDEEDEEKAEEEEESNKLSLARSRQYESAPDSCGWEESLPQAIDPTEHELQVAVSNASKAVVAAAAAMDIAVTQLNTYTINKRARTK